MYEAYYAPLPDVQAYLRRIGAQRKAPSKEYLDELIFAHQTHVVFENIDVCDLHRPISLATEDIFRKVVTNGRGGYCFELNHLFVKLLQALGFEAWSSPCRTLSDDGFLPPIRHRGNIVRIDGRLYFCDVGYGGPVPSFAIEVEDGIRQSKNGETYWLENAGEPWWLLCRVAGGKNDLVKVGPIPEDEDAVREEGVVLISTALWEPVDFIFINEACQQPYSNFYYRRGVNLRRPDGYIALTGSTFARLKNGVRERREVSEEEARGIIRSEFGLNIDFEQAVLSSEYFVDKRE